MRKSSGIIISWVVISAVVFIGASSSEEKVSRLFELRDPFVSPLSKVKIVKRHSLGANNEVMTSKSQNQKWIEKPDASETTSSDEKKMPKLHIKGIMWQGNKGLIILEDGIYTVGDSYKHCTIVNVKDRKAVLNCGEEKYEYVMQD